MKPARHQITILKQVVELIPRNLVAKLAKEFGVDKQSRSISPWSHVVSLLFAQLSHALSLNDIVDTLRNHSGALLTVREAVPHSRNGLSNAKRTRNADMAEALFWQVLEAFQSKHPTFGMGRKYCGMPRRFKRLINVVDSTTIKLVANCMDWAKHRRKKAAAKCHMRLDLQTFLPRFAVVKAASTSDATEARRLCAGMKDGEVVVFDKAYVDYAHLYELTKRGVFWVTRAKDNMAHDRGKALTKPKGRILCDRIVKLKAAKSFQLYPGPIRVVDAMIEIDGKEQILTFITNNLEWAPSSIAELYKGRWGIEVFFKQIKQTLQLADFLGHNENAVRWQVWTALLAYLLLRMIAFLSGWKRTFARLFTALRGVLWSRLDMISVLDCCGTASGEIRMRGRPEEAYLPGFII